MTTQEGCNRHKEQHVHRVEKSSLALRKREEARAAVRGRKGTGGHGDGLQSSGCLRPCSEATGGAWSSRTIRFQARF